jgi:hypothetical protein
MNNTQSNAGILKLSIDVTKIDKEKLYRGQKGTYLDLSILLKDQPDQYGQDGMAVQDVGKAARDAGEKGAILGNAKWAIHPTPPAATPAPPAHSGPATTAGDEEDEIPF